MPTLKNPSYIQLCTFKTFIFTLSPAADSIIKSSTTLLATVLGETVLLILALITIIILAICLIKCTRKRKRSESTYDKLWVHTRQGCNRFSNNGAKRRDNEHNAFTLSSQQMRTYETVQDIDNVVLQTLTFGKQGAESVREGAVVSNQTSIEIETELTGNEEGLYDVTGKCPTKVNANSTIEEESSCSGVTQPTSHNCQTEKLDVHSTEKMDFEVESNNSEEVESVAESADEETESVDEEIESADEGAVIQTNQRDVAAQSGEYSQITMSHGIKKSMNINEINDAVIVSPATSNSLISTEKDTGSSSGYEEGSNGSLSQSIIPQSQSLPMPEDDKFSSCNQKKTIDSTEKQSVDEKATTNTRQKGMQVVPKGAEYAKPRKVNVVEGIYDVVVNQSATRKASSSTPPHVEPYAVCTLPILSKVPQNPCAVGKDSPAAIDEEYKHSHK